MQDLKVTLIQTDLFWEDIPKNLDHFGRLLDRVTDKTDLILLPETFNTGFSINPAAFAEKMEGRSMQFLRDAAKKKEAVIMATMLIREGNDNFNRLACVFPDGRCETYDKRHLFRMSEEYRIINGGKKKLITEVKGWKILPLICYDLRFPVWSKNTWKRGVYEYDLMVCLANWPASRSHVWTTFLTARAMENQACVAGVNRIGNDGYGTGHSGDTLALNAKGQEVYRAAAGKEEIKTVTFSEEELKIFRDSFTVGMDWDEFTINIT